MATERNRAKRERWIEERIVNQYHLNAAQYKFLAESYLREVLKDPQAKHLANFETYIKHLKDTD